MPCVEEVRREAYFKFNLCWFFSGGISVTGRKVAATGTEGGFETRLNPFPRMDV